MCVVCALRMCVCMCMLCAFEYSCVRVLMCPVLAHGNCAMHSKRSVQCTNMSFGFVGVAMLVTLTLVSVCISCMHVCAQRNNLCSGESAIF